MTAEGEKAIDQLVDPLLAGTIAVTDVPHLEIALGPVLIPGCRPIEDTGDPEVVRLWIIATDLEHLHFRVGIMAQTPTVEDDPLLEEVHREGMTVCGHLPRHGGPGRRTARTDRAMYLGVAPVRDGAEMQDQGVRTFAPLGGTLLQHSAMSKPFGRYPQESHQHLRFVRRAPPSFLVEITPRSRAEISSFRARETSHLIIERPNQV